MKAAGVLPCIPNGIVNIAGDMEGRSFRQANYDGNRKVLLVKLNVGPKCGRVEYSDSPGPGDQSELVSSLIFEAPNAPIRKVGVMLHEQDLCENLYG